MDPLAYKVRRAKLAGYFVVMSAFGLKCRDLVHVTNVSRWRLSTHFGDFLKSI